MSARSVSDRVDELTARDGVETAEVGGLDVGVQPDPEVELELVADALQQHRAGEPGDEGDDRPR